jgi:tRNA U38,U39,U40 pseudouridine synthase TruA
MFNIYKTKGSGRFNGAQGSTSNDNAVENDLKDFIENESHKICKLRISLCRRTDTGLERVSEFINTNLIKESTYILQKYA